MFVAIRRLTLLAGFLFIVSLLGRASAQSTAPLPLSAQEKRGKQIYLRAASPSGKAITAYLGDPPVEMPASALTCANCHGFDGQGKPEGGVVPSDITWETLAKPYGGVAASGRKHPPYSDRAAAIAITKGLDPAGNRLGAAMPRYDIAPEDVADLIAYLKRLGSDFDPGISPASIRIGTFIPAEGAMAEAGEAVTKLLAAYFDEINSQGGVFNRKIDLRVARLPKDRTGESTAVARFIKDEQVFALAAPFIAGSEKTMTALMESEETPLVAPMTLLPETGFPLNRRVFYLLSGLNEQARALVHFAKQNARSDGRFALVAPAGELNRALIVSLESEGKKLGVSLSQKVDYPPSHFEAVRVAKQLSGIETVFFLGSPAEGKALADEAEKLAWSFNLCMPGALAGRELFDAPKRFEKHIFLSFPTLPNDQSKLALLELSALAERHQLSTRHLAMLTSALSAAKLLVEGLKLSGRDLSREKLITALEGFYQFETGLTPPITYGPNRRIGALGAYVVALDLENKGFTPASDWLALD